jgi:hypothetical protein
MRRKRMVIRKAASTPRPTPSKEAMIVDDSGETIRNPVVIKKMIMQKVPKKPRLCCLKSLAVRYMLYMRMRSIAH